MDELNGRMLACQILITGLIARVANEQEDPYKSAKMKQIPTKIGKHHKAESHSSRLRPPPSIHDECFDLPA